MLQWIQTHGLESLIIFWLFSVAVSSMPSPKADERGFYQWFYGFSHGLLQLAAGAINRIPQVRKFIGTEPPADAGKKPEAVFVLLLSNPSNFFHADNKNLATGAGSALSTAGLSAAVQKFGDQVDPNKKPILVSPTRLLCGTALRVTAKEL